MCNLVLCPGFESVVSHYLLLPVYFILGNQNAVCRDGTNKFKASGFQTALPIYCSTTTRRIQIPTNSVFFWTCGFRDDFKRQWGTSRGSKKLERDWVTALTNGTNASRLGWLRAYLPPCGGERRPPTLLAAREGAKPSIFWTFCWIKNQQALITSGLQLLCHCVACNIADWQKIKKRGSCKYYCDLTTLSAEKTYLNQNLTHSFDQQNTGT